MDIKRFTKEVRSKVLVIRKNPKTIPARYENTLSSVLKVLPVMINYTVDEANKTIIVAAVFHTSLNPNRWRKGKTKQAPIDSGLVAYSFSQ